MSNVPGYDPVLGYLVTPKFINSGNEVGNFARVYGQILTVGNSIVANCYVNINDLLFTFLTASNSLTESDVYECKIYQDLTVSFGISLTYLLTSFSVIKLFNKVVKYLNEK